MGHSLFSWSISSPFNVVGREVSSHRLTGNTFLSCKSFISVRDTGYCPTPLVAVTAIHDDKKSQKNAGNGRMGSEGRMSEGSDHVREYRSHSNGSPQSRSEGSKEKDVDNFSDVLNDESVQHPVDAPGKAGIGETSERSLKNPRVSRQKTFRSSDSFINRAVSESSIDVDAVSEHELKENGFRSTRRTKLICTIGPASNSFEQLEVLAMGGMNVARLNMCHGSREWHREVIRHVRQLNSEKGFSVAIMMDTQGSEIHMGDLGGAPSAKAEVRMA